MTIQEDVEYRKKIHKYLHGLRNGDKIEISALTNNAEVFIECIKEDMRAWLLNDFRFSDDYLFIIRDNGFIKQKRL